MPFSVALPVAEWAPDMPALNLAGTQAPVCMTATNVVPRTPASYGPLPSLGGAVSNALNSACLGSYACLDTSGNVNFFAGDTANLYQMTTSGMTFSAVSKTGGYNCPSGTNWHMALFGNRVIATDYFDNIQTFTLGSSTAFADLSAGAPKAKFIAVVKSWLVAANTSDGTNGMQPQWVWWSANNDPTNWPTPGSATAVALQSTYNPLYGDGGQITGIVGNLANADGAVFQEHAVWRMIFDGSAAVFSFYPAGNLRGCQAPNSIVQVGNIVYFLAEDGFYSFDGAIATPIGVNRVDKFFLSDLDMGNKVHTVGTADPQNKMIFWAYPGSGNTGGTPNRLLIYNWAIDRWSWAQVTAEWMMRALTFGYTLDQLYTILGYTLDKVAYPLDSNVWKGGVLALGAFDTAHKLNFFAGQNMAATVDTAEIQPTTGRRSMVSMSRPLIDGGTPTVNIGHRNRLVDAPLWDGAVPFNSDGYCPQATDDRYIRAEITTQAGDVWSHLQGVEIDVDPSSIV